MNNYHKTSARLADCAKNEDDETFLRILNEHLALIGTESVSANPDKEIPLIYIVGAPRSGTTLLSQVVSRYLPVGYVNNLMARFWLKPVVGVRLSKILLGKNYRQAIGFESKHGVTDGLVGPHEFGYFWEHWFQLNDSKTHHLSAEALARLDRGGLQNILEQELLSNFDMPVVFKNVICGFQAPFLVNVHKNSLFIHITRDLRSTCASILESRFKRYGSYDAWWSLKPSTFLSFPDDPVSQVVNQVIDCRREFDEQVLSSGAEMIKIKYEDFCRNPNYVLLMICSKVANMGWLMAPTDSVPPFQVQNDTILPDELIKKLDNKIKSLHI